ncbi:hypothetical protein CUZ56_02064 [Saezia sanguinis]|uniref:Zinc finger/thioredoxin putative domain-containing protein n=1 Tax=Saezia sanguinis TaxID=1965230 RepID=A0A433SC56_9BURK|nr:zinc-ribbon and DUF3426 domain-containing protein [Saezia sanguinis]RUS66338.1 hypothetical protein CUZ56_02064 [Saezia sanguinis]
MVLAARCPECGTSFRIVPDQLKISDGWVRCGHCAHIFDAYETQYETPEETLHPQPDTTQPDAAQNDNLPQEQASAESPAWEPDSEPPSDFHIEVIDDAALESPAIEPLPADTAATPETSAVNTVPEEEPTTPSFQDSLLSEFHIGWQESVLPSIHTTDPVPPESTFPKKLFSPSQPEKTDNLTPWFKSQIESNAAPAPISAEQHAGTADPLTQEQTPSADTLSPATDQPATEASVPQQIPGSFIERASQSATATPIFSDAPTLETVEARKKQLFPLKNPAENAQATTHFSGLKTAFQPEAEPDVAAENTTTPQAATSSPIMSITLGDDDDFSAPPPATDDDEPTQPRDIFNPSSVFELSTSSTLDHTDSKLPSSYSISDSYIEILHSELPEEEPLPEIGLPSAADEAEPQFSFIKTAHRNTFWQRPIVRIFSTMVFCCLLVTLVLQICLAFRDTLAAQAPSLRPALESLCEPLHCSVSYPRNIQGVSIDHSGFQIIGDNRFQLVMTLRNASAEPIAPPWVELTLTDSIGQTVIRKTLSPDELGITQPFLQPQEEIFIDQTLVVNALDIRGFNTALFYP